MYAANSDNFFNLNSQLSILYSVSKLVLMLMFACVLNGMSARLVEFG